MVGCIVPWNYPLLLLAWKLAPALAAGNTTVCKPSELTPLSTLMLAACFEHLPAGVVNLLAGAGDVGEAIVRDERVDCIAFTGSVETGKRVAVAVRRARRARRTSRWAARTHSSSARTSPMTSRSRRSGGAWAAYLNAGQVCTSAERFYVMDEVYDDYVREFVDYTESLVLGDPLDPRTDVGPMVSGAPARQGRGPGRAGGRRRGRARDRRARRRPGARPLLLPRGRHGRARRDRAAARGDLRPGGADRAGREPRRGDRSRQLHALRAGLQRVHARPRARSCAACARSRRAPCGSTTRSPTTTRARSAA